MSRVLNIGGEGEVPGAINLNSLIAPLRGIDEIVARGPLVKGDFLQLPFKSGAFSEVVGTRLPFMHGQFAEQTAAEAFRVLAPGGRVSLSASQGGSAVWTDYLKQAGFEVQVVGRQVTGVRP